MQMPFTYYMDQTLNANMLDQAYANIQARQKLWDYFFLNCGMNNFGSASSSTIAKIRAEYADSMLAERDKRFGVST